MGLLEWEKLEPLELVMITQLEVRLLQTRHWKPGDWPGGLDGVGA